VTLDVDELAGTAELMVALPPSQGSVAGSPATAGMAEKVQLRASPTEALSITTPPLALIAAGDTVNELITGLVSDHT
jgi:hypothetical protein